MSVHPATVLATFPVTQQVVGAVLVVKGLCQAVANLAKRIFHGIQYSVEYRKSETKESNMRIHELKGKIDLDLNEIKEGVEVILFGLLIMTPIAGTIFGATKWLKETHQRRATV